MILHQTVGGENVDVGVENILQKFFHRSIGGVVDKNTLVAFEHGDDGVEVLIDDLAILFYRRIRLLFSRVLNRIHL